MRSELTTQRRQLFVPPSPQDGLPDSQRTPEPGHDSSHSRDLHLRRGVTYQIHFAIPHLPPNRHPPTVNGYARPLPFQRLYLFFLEEPRKTFLCVAAILTDDSERAALRRFRD